MAVKEASEALEAATEAPTTTGNAIVTTEITTTTVMGAAGMIATDPALICHLSAVLLLLQATGLPCPTQKVRSICIGACDITGLH